MLRDLAFHTAKAFRSTHPKNPLNELLDDADKTIVFILLKAYTTEEEGGEKRGKGDYPLERAAKVMDDAAKLAAKLGSEVFQGPASDLLSLIATDYRDIPKRIVEFSTLAKLVLDAFGKRGHKARTFSNYWLVMVSEFVRMRTGKHYDEHLAELIQAIASRPDNEDFSGDAIRKKRKFLKSRYPPLHAQALKRMRDLCNSLALWDSNSAGVTNVGSHYPN